MNGKDENIYVFICAKSNCYGRTIVYSGAYSISKDANMDDVIDYITEDMNEYFEEKLGGIGQLPRVCITSMNEISKELYDRLHQEH